MTSVRDLGGCGDGQQARIDRRMQRLASHCTVVGHMVDSATRLYSIVVKDAETGATLIFTAADWSADEKRLVVTEKRLAGAMISMLRSLDANRSNDRSHPFGA